MTVKEFIKIIRKFPNDAEIFYLDTYWESEGYGDNADNSAWNPIENIKYNAEDNSIELIQKGVNNDNLSLYLNRLHYSIYKYI